MRSFLPSSVWILLSFVAAFSACSRSPSVTSLVAASAASVPSGAAARTSLGLSYDKPAVVGANVHATATDLPPGKTVELAWGTVTGGWVIEDYYHFRGKKYSETTRKPGQFPVHS